MNHTDNPSLGNVRGLALQKLNEETDAFRRQLHAILLNKGFKRTFAGNRSAMYHWDYERGVERVSIDGWHGTGKKGTNRHWGDGKTVMTLYHMLDQTARYKSEVVVEIDNFTGSTFKDDVEIEDTRSEADLLKGHAEGVAKMLQYVRALP